MASHQILTTCILVLLVGNPVAAQTTQEAREICGSTSESISDQLKVDLDAKAQTIARLGSAELKAAVERTKSEIVIAAGRSDTARALHYFAVVGCVAIFIDSSLDAVKRIEKIGILKNVVLGPQSFRNSPPAAPKKVPPETKRSTPTTDEHGFVLYNGKRNCQRPPPSPLVVVPPAVIDMGEKPPLCEWRDGSFKSTKGWEWGQ